MSAPNQVPSLMGGGTPVGPKSTMDIEHQWNRRDILRKLRPHLRNEIPRLLALATVSILSALATLVAPLFIARGIDMLGQTGFTVEAFGRILFILAISYAAKFLFDLFIHTNVPIVTQGILKNIRQAAQRRLSRLPLAELDRHPVGDLVSRLTNDLDALQDGLQQVLIQLFSGIVSLVGAFLFILILDWRVALLVLLLTPLNFLVTRYISNRSHDLYRTNSRLVGDVNSMIEELTAEQKLLRNFDYQETAAEEFSERNRALYENGQEAQFISSLTNPASRFVNNILYIAVGTLASILGFRGILTIGEISALLSYALQYTKPVNELSGVIAEVQRGIAGAERALQVLELKPEDPETDKSPLVLREGAISFDQMSFGYTPQRTLIENFTLDVPAGRKVAIVGPTGAGKTTLVNLLMRYYDYQSGAILIDGQAIHERTRDSVRNAFGMVLQETWLFAGSVHANIAYAKPDATREEVIAAAKAAHCHDFIELLPNGYETRLGDAETSLSEGQKQLLTIARVMLKNADLLILDEATSSIDTHTERRVQDAFLKMMEGRTSFVIAHRLSTIRDSDLILVLVDGEVVERGTHEELLALKQHYYDLYQSQFVRS